MPSSRATAAPAARAARRSGAVVRIPHGAERRLVARRAERELVQVGLADDDGAGAEEVARRPAHRGPAAAAARAIPRSSASPRRRPDPSPRRESRGAARDTVPAAMLRSARAATASARSSITVMKARRSSLPAAMRSRHARVSSTGETSRRSTSPAASRRLLGVVSSCSVLDVSAAGCGIHRRRPQRLRRARSVSSSGFSRKPARVGVASQRLQSSFRPSVSEQRLASSGEAGAQFRRRQSQSRSPARRRSSICNRQCRTSACRAR